MNGQDTYKALLPAGFEDLLVPQAEYEAQAISDLMAVFLAFGYERVKPPLLEFEESLLSLRVSSLASADTFRVMDPVSRRMMGLRSDVTAQVARIAMSKMSDELRPVRLTYADDVVRINAGQVRTRRQFTQAGCEIVGDDNAQSDIEVAVVALKALSVLDLPDVTIDFALPRAYDAILAAAGADEAQVDELRSRLAGSADKALSALGGLKFDVDVSAQIERLSAVVAGVQKAVDELKLENVSLTIDPLENKGFEYHEGVVFTVFAKGVRGEIGRGGRYMIYDGEAQKESAVGFTLYMDTIRHGANFKLSEVRVFVEPGASWAEIDKLQQEGWITVCGGTQAGCSHIYKNGQVEEL